MLQALYFQFSTPTFDPPEMVEAVVPIATKLALVAPLAAARQEQVATRLLEAIIAQLLEAATTASLA